MGIGKALAVVFRKPLYSALALAVALALLLSATWIPNLTLLKYAYTSESLSVWNLLGASPAYFLANTVGLRAGLVVLVALLSGIDAALVVFYFRRRIQKNLAGGAGILGAIVGMAGVGCAACGSILLSSFFGFGATAAIVGALPFGGAEFAVVGVAVLVIAIYTVARKIANPDACRMR